MSGVYVAVALWFGAVLSLSEAIVSGFLLFSLYGSLGFFASASLVRHVYAYSVHMLD